MSRCLWLATQYEPQRSRMISCLTTKDSAWIEEVAVSTFECFSPRDFSCRAPEGSSMVVALPLCHITTSNGELDKESLGIQ